jgi:hypothetical protein
MMESTDTTSLRTGRVSVVAAAVLAGKFWGLVLLYVSMMILCGKGSSDLASGVVLVSAFRHCEWVYILGVCFGCLKILD